MVFGHNTTLTYDHDMNCRAAESVAHTDGTNGPSLRNNTWDVNLLDHNGLETLHGGNHMSDRRGNENCETYLEIGDLYVRGEGVELLFRALVVIALACGSHIEVSLAMRRAQFTQDEGTHAQA
jgi:hypothetical protein